MFTRKKKMNDGNVQEWGLEIRKWFIAGMIEPIFCKN